MELSTSRCNRDFYRHICNCKSNSSYCQTV